MAIKNWAWQLTHGKNEPLPSESPYPDKTALIYSVRNVLEAGEKIAGRSPKVHVIGAVSLVLEIVGRELGRLTDLKLGRCGKGAVQFAKDVGVSDRDILKWDLEETKIGGNS